MTKVRGSLLVFPSFGILISIFPSIVTVPFEAAFGHGTHLSIGDLFVLCVPLISMTYAYVVAFYMLLKEQFKTMAILILLGIVQTALSIIEWGLIG